MIKISGFEMRSDVNKKINIHFNNLIIIKFWLSKSILVMLTKNKAIFFFLSKTLYVYNSTQKIKIPLQV